MDEELGQPGEVAMGEEKTLTASQVNDIVKREKLRAAEKVRMEMEAKHQADMQGMQGAGLNTQPQQPFDMDSIKNEMMDRFYDDLAEAQRKAEEEQQTRNVKETVDKYHLNMKRGSELFDDFDSVTADFNPGAFPNAVMLAAQNFDDVLPEIMYELANNPDKILRIDELAKRDAGMAMRELKKLAGSITKNLDAKQNTASAPAPLSKIKSSSVGVDTGKMTLKDFKNQPWLRG